MVSKETIFIVFLDVCTSLVSLLGHMFILLVNAVDAAKSRRLHLGDWLICNISIVNIFTNILNICEDFFLTLSLITISIEAANKCFLVLYLTLNSSYFWFLTWLCFYFCLTIVKIKQRFYICLQKIFPKVVSWLIILTVLESFLSSLFSVWINSQAFLSNTTFTENDHEKSVMMYERYTPHIGIYSATFSVSFIIFYTSALTIIFFLYKHMKTIMDNTEGPRQTPNVQAHVRAIRTILFLLAINILNLLAGVYWFTLNITHIYQYVTLVCSTISNMFLPFILIKGNSKLNKVFQEFYQNWFSSL